jgi:hypothetical protein
MIAWATGTHEFVLRGGTQRATGVQSMIRASSIIAIKGKDFMVRHFDHAPTLTKEMLLARDRYVCAYCAQRFRFEATRSLLNTARLMEENPTLLRLKEFETPEKVTEKSTS